MCAKVMRTSLLGFFHLFFFLIILAGIFSNSIDFQKTPMFDLTEQTESRGDSGENETEKNFDVDKLINSRHMIFVRDRALKGLETCYNECYSNPPFQDTPTPPPEAA